MARNASDSSTVPSTSSTTTFVPVLRIVHLGVGVAYAAVVRSCGSGPLGGGSPGPSGDWWDGRSTLPLRDEPEGLGGMGRD
eukprot:scaffold923_cov288-Pavlova_lutheri.AAC.6